MHIYLTAEQRRRAVEAIPYPLAAEVQVSESG